MNNFFDNILNTVFWKNPIKDYLIAILIFVGSFIILKLLKKIVLSKLKKWSEKTKTKFDDFLVYEMERTLIPVLYVLALDLALEYLDFSPLVNKIIYYVIAVLISIFLINFSVRFISKVIHFYLNKTRAEDSEKSYNSISTLIKIVIWITGILVVLNNFGFNVTTILTGLGIGGIAIALGAQAILGDLFSYFVILFDKPFKIGDYITFDDQKGTVEHIGIKTTKLRSLQGEIIVISNSDLTKSRIHNYQKLEQRRYIFYLFVRYDTSFEKLNQIPLALKKIVEETEKTTFSSAVLKDLSERAISFEIIYYFNCPDYDEFLLTHNQINYKILDYFRENDIRFAFHTNIILENKTGQL